jgi:cytochrome c oxidase subunit IV
VAHGEAEIKKQVKIYVVVFAALAALTIVTVAISYLHLSITAAVVLALLVASIKSGLVALFFMHLVSERRIIIYLLLLTVIFFALLLLLPVFDYL